MSNRREKLLLDLLDKAEAVQRFVDGKLRSDLDTDRLLRSAIERELHNLGEAMRRLRDLDPQFTARISDWKRIIDFRNLLAHGYDAIDQDIVWQVIIDNLPALIADVRRLQKS